ncbi:MAG TPA: hypothetical protein DCL43_15520 [Chitinophagaceae bacterium]|nr:hypothetical protein [Chitinophagaceae bacterium]HAN38636.1 hypothetical protein [Chitinophagaceae bacterium]
MKRINNKFLYLCFAFLYCISCQNPEEHFNRASFCYEQKVRSILIAESQYYEIAGACANSTDPAYCIEVAAIALSVSYQMAESEYLDCMGVNV